MHRRTSNLYYGASVVAGFAALLISRGDALSFVGIALALSCCALLAALPYLIKRSARSG
jgi:predicted RND superfamily exporter protein